MTSIVDRKKNEEKKKREKEIDEERNITKCPSLDDAPVFVLFFFFRFISLNFEFH